MEVSLSEKLSEAYDKVSGALTILWGALPGGRFQFGTEKIRGVPLKIWKNLPAACGDYYKPFFQEHARKTWLVYNDEIYTYADALAQYEALAAELVHGFKIKHGDRVGIAMRNLPEFLITFLAVVSVGGVVVPLNALWKADELEYAVSDSQCSVMVVDPPRNDLCHQFKEYSGYKTILCRAQENTSGGGFDMRWEDVIESGLTRKSPVLQIGPDDDAMIMYTSGSTGFPKGVVHTQRSVGTAMKMGEIIPVMIKDPGNVSLMAVPLFHITALSPIALTSIASGGKIVMMRKWDAGEAIRLIKREGVTRFTGVPTMVMDMMEHADFTPENVSTLKNMMSGGAPAPPSQLAKMRSKAKSVKPGQGYGLTETMAFCTAISGAEYALHPTSCGRPLPLIVEIQIKDPETGKVMKDGERGEVCVRSVFVMKAYWNKEEATTKAIDKDGFFHTGDIGKMEGGFCYILDRLKDLIIRGGENIDCSEVEAALMTHSGARECSVFGLPDERLGEVVGAAVWVNDESVTPEQLAATVAGQLAKFKVPEVQNIFIHSEALPKGATGKLDKKGLRDHYAKLVQARVASKL